MRKTIGMNDRTLRDNGRWRGDHAFPDDLVKLTRRTQSAVYVAANSFAEPWHDRDRCHPAVGATKSLPPLQRRMGYPASPR